MANKKEYVLSPGQLAIMKSPEVELEERAELQAEVRSLVDLSGEVSDLRERTMVEARIKDIEFISKIDVIITTILDSLSEVDIKEKLKTAIHNMFKKNDMRQLRELMSALGVTIDKREQLLGFDSTRAGMGKKKLRLELKWGGTIRKGKDGEPEMVAGIQAQVSE